MTSLPKATNFLTATAVFLSRFSSLPANFSPIGSFGFFSKNPWLYACTILLFDILKGGFYKGFFWTYLGFAVYFLLGRVATNSSKKQIVLLPVASLLFFILSNIGVWWFWYPQTLEGLLACFTAALPFYRNTFLSDLFFGYTAIFIQSKQFTHSYNLIKSSQPSKLALN